jgi:hypothetical protein
LNSFRFDDENAEYDPAPTARDFYIFTGMIIHKPANSAAYTVGGGDDLTVRYTDKTGTQLATCETTGFLNQQTEQLRYVFSVDGSQREQRDNATLWYERRAGFAFV